MTNELIFRGPKLARLVAMNRMAPVGSIFAAQTRIEQVAKWTIIILAVMGTISVASWFGYKRMRTRAVAGAQQFAQKQTAFRQGAPGATTSLRNLAAA